MNIVASCQISLGIPPSKELMKDLKAHQHLQPLFPSLRQEIGDRGRARIVWNENFTPTCGVYADQAKRISSAITDVVTKHSHLDGGFEITFNFPASYPTGDNIGLINSKTTFRFDLPGTKSGFVSISSLWDAANGSHLHVVAKNPSYFQSWWASVCFIELMVKNKFVSN